MVDVPGTFLKLTPYFRGKGRLQRRWEKSVAGKNLRRTAKLPDGSRLSVNLDIPYERMVWLQNEEWNELRYLSRKLARGDVFIDVGANVGLWSLVAASTVGSEGRVVSFEPNPATFGKLEENLKRNDYAQALPFPYAVSRSKGMVNFCCEAQHNISAIARPSGTSPAIAVPCVALDEFLPGHLGETPIAGLKLDTEGHELEALQGAAGLLARHSPWLVVEFNTELMPSPVLGNWPVYDFFRTLGYRAFIYDSDPADEQEVGEAFSVRGYRNILFQRLPASPGPV